MKQFLAVLALLALLTVSALAQEPTETVKVRTSADAKMQIELAQAVGTGQFSFEAKVVKGAPYTATSESETIQLLTDGNRIRNKNTTNVARDSEGRTRREIAGTTPGVPAQVFINDPVTNTSYTLNPKSRTAQKMQRRVEVRVAGEKIAAEQTIKLRSEEGGTVVVNGQPLEQLDAAKRAVLEEKMAAAKAEVAAGGKPAAGVFSATSGGGFVIRTDKQAPKESLGQQMIEGVMCEGSRRTLTIPAGTVGNDLPLNIVSEEWYSPELQALVLTKRTDPRNGETTYRLTNIIRSEPSPALFEVPADYTMQDAPKAIKK